MKHYPSDETLSKFISNESTVKTVSKTISKIEKEQDNMDILMIARDYLTKGEHGDRIKVCPVKVLTKMEAAIKSGLEMNKENLLLLCMSEESVFQSPQNIQLDEFGSSLDGQSYYVEKPAHPKSRRIMFNDVCIADFTDSKKTNKNIVCLNILFYSQNEKLYNILFNHCINEFFRLNAINDAKDHTDFSTEIPSVDINKSISEFIKSRANQVRDEYQGLVDRSANLSRDYIAALRQENDKKILLDGLLSTTPSVIDVSNIEEINRVFIKDNSLHILTNNIVITSSSGKMYECGILKLSLNLHDGKLYLVNTTRTITGYSDRTVGHPHVAYNGNRFCLDTNVSAAIPQLINDLEFSVLCKLIINTVKTANEDDPAGAHIYKFPEYKPEKKESVVTVNKEEDVVTISSEPLPF